MFVIISRMVIWAFLSNFLNYSYKKILILNIMFKDISKEIRQTIHISK